ncbi:nuclease-related domain-containing protein [Mammaliicoccus sp. Dog046]|uniref:nuclease-related domain-containing protein n=1 Tax=Mammaliicoccus sp. Dog046 TaxID=3034233 RepID=UPI002B262D29|nr:nuclease-related domain-containing protein [Mammaliicoccus sp. Dog046]WQK85627.1 nuclease-related domain-containing protein [Mammaliicoccus sp. Dog046]
MEHDFHRLIESLMKRTELSQDILQKYDNYKKGKEGEEKFLKVLQSIKGLNYIYNLQMKNSYQFDFIVVTDQCIYQFEIKNYSGNYEYRNGNLITQNDLVIKYPFAQLDRNEHFLRQVLKSLNIHHKVKSYVVFTNDYFRMTGDTDTSFMIFPTQLNYLKQLLLNSTYEQTHSLTTSLKNLNQPFNHDYYIRPNYQFENVKPGIRCTHCLNIIEYELEYKKKEVTCHFCKEKSNRKALILNTLNELFLIKGEPFTMREARIWCNGIHRNSLAAIIKGNFKAKRHNKTIVYYK